VLPSINKVDDDDDDDDDYYYYSTSYQFMLLYSSFLRVSPRGKSLTQRRNEDLRKQSTLERRNSVNPISKSLDDISES